MAKRRMVSNDIIENDNFTNNTPQQQLLYLFLLFHSDDDGICTSVKMQKLFTNTDNNDLQALIDSNLIIKDDESDAICIVDWHTHNLLPKDKYKETELKAFKEKIFVTEYLKLTLSKTDYNYSKIYSHGGSIATALKEFKEYYANNHFDNDNSLDDIYHTGETEKDIKNKQRLMDQAMQL